MIDTKRKTMKSNSPAAAIRRTRTDSFVRVASLPGSSVTNRKAVSRAVAAGVLVKVGRGLYYKGRQTTYGMTRPSTMRVVEATLGRSGHGPAGHSAAALWGVTTQVAPSMRVATLKATDALKGVTLVRRSNLARIDLNAREIALLELLRDPDAYVEAGWDALVDAVVNAVDHAQIELPRVVAAAKLERDRATRENMDRLVGSAESRAAVAA